MLLLQPALLFAQTVNEKIDSLHTALNQTEDEVAIIDIYNELAFSYRRTALDSVDHYSALALSAALRLNYKKGLLWAYKNQGIYRYKTDFSPDSILHVINLALEFAKETNDYYNEAALNNNIGLVKASEDKIRESAKYYLLGLEILNTNDHPPSFMEGLMCGNLSICYQKLDEPEQALFYAQKGISVANQLNNQSLESIISSAYSAALIKLGRIEESIQYLHKSIDLHEKLGDYQSLGNSWYQMVHAYMELGNFNTAEQYLNKIEELSISKSFTSFGPRIQLLSAKIENGYKNHDQALIHAQQAIAAAQTSKNFNFEIEAYEVLIETYKNLGRYEDAFQLHEQTSFFKDSLYAIDKVILVEELDARYQVSKKEQEIEYLNKGQEQQKIFIRVLSALVVVSIALFAIFFRWRRSTVKNQQIIEEKNLQLKEYINQNLQLENFAYIASHDLKTPLRNIISFSQLLERKLKHTTDVDIKSYLHFISNGSKELMSLTQDLLDYSTLNKKELQLKHFQIDKFIKDFLESIQSIIKETQAQIDLEVPEKWINADPIKLKQAFQNLILNAIKFHRPNENPVVKIQMTDLGDSWEFAISDQGIGIAPEFHEKIFLLLKRLNTKDDYEGTGMGLAITKRVIDQHGGKIWISSEVDAGSTFYFTLPKYPTS